MLLVATAHHALKKGSILPPECNYHKVETIRLIKDRLKSRIARTDEAVIAGIACLVAYDVNLSYALLRARPPIDR